MSGYALAVALIAVVVCGALALLLVHTRRDLRALRADLAHRTAAPPPPPPPPIEDALSEPEPRDRPSATVVPYVITGVDDTVYVPTPAQVRHATLARPEVRAAALAHGLRRAMAVENRDRVAALMRREFRRRRKMRMRAGRRAARMARMEPVHGTGPSETSGETSEEAHGQ